MNSRALIVEDDPQIADLLSMSLQDINIDSIIVEDGYDALRKVKSEKFDIILLDLMLKSIGGVEVCKQIRHDDLTTPIIMVTAKSEEIDKVVGLETGADDYITKPFSIRELQARVKAILRRAEKKEHVDTGKSKILALGDIIIDLDKRSVVKEGERLDLTSKEFEILSVLACSPGKSFSRQNLLNLVWGYNFEGLEHTVNSHINRLRAKIEDDMTEHKYILTTWGYGYRFNEKT